VSARGEGTKVRANNVFGGDGKAERRRTVEGLVKTV